MTEVFDLEDVYDAEVSPLMAQIIEICKKHRIPMVASFIFGHDDEGGIDTCDTVLQYDGRKFSRLDKAFSAMRGQDRAPPVIITATNAAGEVVSSEVIL
jgi:hypothetical protein